MTEQNQRMDNRVKDWRDERPSLIQLQRHLLEKGLYSDVVVKIGGGGTAGPVELIPCHRYVLMSRSEVFERMLEGSWRNGYSEIMNTDDHSKVIDLSKNLRVTAQGFRTFLRVRVPISNAI
jgi:hypothetical protein